MTSDAKVDTCGICNGDDTSCKRVSGTYKKKFEYSAGRIKVIAFLFSLIIRCI